MRVFYWLVHVPHTLIGVASFSLAAGGCVQPLGQDLTKAPEMDAVRAWYVRWRVLGVVRDCIAVEGANTRTSSTLLCKEESAQMTRRRHVPSLVGTSCKEKGAVPCSW